MESNPGEQLSTRDNEIKEESIQRESPKITLQICQEKQINKGEDAQPLLVLKKQKGYTGVFDGMGGAGAALLNWRGDEHSGAYIAAQLVQITCLHYIQKRNEIQKEELENYIHECLRSENIKYKQERVSRLKSNLLKNFPTTLSIIEYNIVDNEHVNINSFWAGDSRNYMLSPTKGLIQLTKDDLKNEMDPLDNLLNDSPLSNYINENSFSIHEFRLENNVLPLILLSATDGCFGYYPTPMHFEYLLLHSLQDAQDENEWSEIIKKELTDISGDDFSMALIVIENNSTFQEIKQKYLYRLQVVREKYIDCLTSRNLIKEQVDLVKSLWEEYREDYLIVQ